MTEPMKDFLFPKNGPLQAIIFDLGDTLIYFDGDWSDSFARADLELYRSLTAAGVRLDRETFLTLYHAQIMAYYQERDSEFIEYTTKYILENVLRQMGAPLVSEETLMASLADMYTVFQSQWFTDEQAVPVLEALKRKGFRLGLVSNASDDANVQFLVDQAGIRSYFDQVITSAAMGIRKPDPKIFAPLLQFWDLPTNRVAMVGDTLGADILGARNAGMRSIWVTRHADTASNRAHFETIRPDFTVTNLAEIPGLVGQFFQASG
jgi:putative hydrolase of the HAD superfamily